MIFSTKTFIIKVKNFVKIRRNVRKSGPILSFETGMIVKEIVKYFT